MSEIDTSEREESKGRHEREREGHEECEAGEGREERKKGAGRARNVVFVLVVAAMLFGVIGYRTYVEVADVELETYSALEHRNYQTFPGLAWDSILDETFQDDFEQFVADCSPMRDQIILAHAAIQRSSIEFANLVCGYDAYPTYYGSSYVYIQSVDATWRKLRTTAYYTEERLAGWAEMVSGIVEDNSEIDWAMYLVDDNEISESSPLNELSGNVATYSYCKELFLDGLVDSCTVVDGSYDDLDEFLEDYSLTDHHWNVRGAMEAYGKIVEAFGKEPVDFGDVYVADEGPCWGSYSRNGRAVIGEGDAILDVEYEHSDLLVTVNGAEKDISFLDMSWAEDYEGYDGEMFDSFYLVYYHQNQQLVEIENLDCDNGETLLIVADSYSNIMERFFAEDYQYVYAIDPGAYEYGTLQEFIDEHDVDDAVFILRAESMDELEEVI